jgi:hypothetical protein
LRCHKTFVKSIDISQPQSDQPISIVFTVYDYGYITRRVGYRFIHPPMYSYCLASLDLNSHAVDSGDNVGRIRGTAVLLPPAGGYTEVLLDRLRGFPFSALTLLSLHPAHDISGGRESMVWSRL